MVFRGSKMGLNFNKEIVGPIDGTPSKIDVVRCIDMGEVNWTPINISLNWHCGGE
jgi:hypothetical protein